MTWRPAVDNTLQWAEVRFEKPRPIYGIIVGGDPNTDEFVTSYRVLFSEDGQLFSYLKENREPKIISGLADSAQKIRVIFRQPVEARVVRVNPFTWHKKIAMQFELVGCEDTQNYVTGRGLPMLTERSVEPGRLFVYSYY